MPDISIPIDGIVAVDCWGTLYGQATRTKFVYKNTSPAIRSADNDFQPRFTAEHQTFVRAVLSQDWTITNQRVYVYNPGPGFTVVAFKDYAQAASGSILSAGCPPTVAGVVRKRTGAIGRANRGRWYFPAVPVASVLSGQFTAGALTNWNTLAGQLSMKLTNGFMVDWFTPQLARYSSTGALINVQDITACATDPILRSQRRREIGVGI